MSNYLGRTFTHYGIGKAKNQKATVISQTEPQGKRGKVTITARLEDGTEIKTDPRHAAWSMEFAPPATGPMFSKGDKYRYDRNGRIFCA